MRRLDLISYIVIIFILSGCGSTSNHTRIDEILRADPEVDAFLSMTSDSLIIGKGRGQSYESQMDAYDKAVKESRNRISEQILVEVQSKKTHIIQENESLDDQSEFHDFFESAIKISATNLLGIQKEIVSFSRKEMDLEKKKPVFYQYVAMAVPKSAADSYILDEINRYREQAEEYERSLDNANSQIDSLIEDSKRMDKIDQQNKETIRNLIHILGDLDTLKQIVAMKKNSRNWNDIEKKSWFQEEQADAPVNAIDMNIIDMKLDNLSYHFNKKFQLLTEHIEPFTNWILFDLGETNFQESEYIEQNLTILENSIKKLSKMDYEELHIFGYSDIIPPTQSNISHEDFGKKRANNVMDYLISKGLPKDKIKTFGLGPKSLPYPSDTKLHNVYNRRVKIQLIY